MYAAREPQMPGREYMPVQEYLEREETALEKHEYKNGYRYPLHAGPHGFDAMAGAREPHVRLSTRLARFVGQQLEDSPCVPYASDMRLTRVTRSRETGDPTGGCEAPAFPVTTE